MSKFNRYQLVNTIGAVLQSQVLAHAKDKAPFSSGHLNLLANSCAAQGMLNGCTDGLAYTKIDDISLIAVILHSLLITNVRIFPAETTLKEMQEAVNSQIGWAGFIETNGRLDHRVFYDDQFAEHATSEPNGFVEPMFCFANISASAITGETPSLGYVFPLLETYGVHTEESMIHMLRCTEKFFGNLLTGYSQIQAFTMLNKALQEKFKPSLSH